MKLCKGLFGILLTALLLLTGVQASAATGTDWNTQVISATGTGIPPLGAVGAQARILAKRAAIVDAQRQLIEAVNGVQVDAETTVEKMMVVSDLVRTKVSGVLSGARVVSENITVDGAYEVTMQVPLYGVNGIAQAVLEPPVAITPFPTPQPAPSVSITVTGGYTGVVIDCRGLGVNPVMSPVIEDVSGVKLYGHINLDYDLVIRDGMVSYAHDMAQAQRAGANPLVIRAERMSNHNANPVVSVSDGNRMLLENNSSGFLSRTAVVFLY